MRVLVADAGNTKLEKLVLSLPVQTDVQLDDAAVAAIAPLVKSALGADVLHVDSVLIPPTTKKPSLSRQADKVVSSIMSP